MSAGVGKPHEAIALKKLLMRAISDEHFRTSLRSDVLTAFMSVRDELGLGDVPLRKVSAIGEFDDKEFEVLGKLAKEMPDIL